MRQAAAHHRSGKRRAQCRWRRCATRWRTPTTSTGKPRLTFRINECEAEVKHKLGLLQELSAENSCLRSAIAKAEREIAEVRRHGEYDDKKAQMAAELRSVKEQWRTAYYSKIDAQKALINRHSAVVDLNKK